MKRLQAGDIDYKEAMAASAFKNKFEVDGITAEQNASVLKVGPKSTFRVTHYQTHALPRTHTHTNIRAINGTTLKSGWQKNKTTNAHLTMEWFDFSREFAWHKAQGEQ